MKFKFFITYFLGFVLGCALLLINTTNVFAHPGMTDSNGGHTCRTNCPSWGLNYGEYHYHSSGNSGSGFSSSGSSSDFNFWPYLIGGGVVYLVVKGSKNK